MDVSFHASGEADRIDLSGLDLPGIKMEFIRCQFENPLDLHGGRFGEVVFSDCVFAQGTQPRDLSLDFQGSTLDGLSLDLIPHDKPYLGVGLDRVTVHRNAYIQVTNSFDGTRSFLGLDPPDKNRDEWQPSVEIRKAASRDQAAVLVVRAYQARIGQDLEISITCAESANLIRAVALVAPDIDVHGRLQISGYSTDETDRYDLPVSCNLELAKVGDQLRLSGIKIAGRLSDGKPGSKSRNKPNANASPEDEDARKPALSLVDARIGTLFLHGIALVPFEPAKTGEKSSLALPFYDNSFNVTGTGVLRGIRLDEAVVEFRAEKGSRPDYSKQDAEIWSRLADEDTQVGRDRALVALHKALEAGGARSAPEELKNEIQKGRRRKERAAHWEGTPGNWLLVKSLAAVLYVFFVLELTDRVRPHHIPPWVNRWGVFPAGLDLGLAVFLMCIALPALLLLVLALLRRRRSQKTDQNSYPMMRALAVFVVLVAVSLIYAFGGRGLSSDWGFFNALVLALSLPVACLFVVSRRGRRMITQGIESVAQAATSYVQDGKRPLAVLSMLAVVWSMMSAMYFFASDRGFMAPEEIEAFHLEPWFQQHDTLRIRLDDCAGTDCGGLSSAATWRESADYRSLAEVYLRMAIVPLVPSNPHQEPLDAQDLEHLARIPGFAFFNACRANWTEIAAVNKLEWAARVIEFSGLRWDDIGLTGRQAAERLAQLDQTKICSWYLPAEYSAFQPFLYAADVVIPLLSLRQEEEWSIRVVDPFTNQPVFWAYVCLVCEAMGTLVGWLCVLILVSEVTGLTNPGRRFR